MMSGTALKIIAVVLMTIDHIGVYFPGVPLWFRWLGRLSAPLFFFCAAEGIVRTRDPKAYLKRLWLASLVMVLLESAVPFALDMYFGIGGGITNNIFLSIFEGTLVVYLLMMTKGDGKRRAKYLLGYAGYQLVLAVLYLLTDGIGNLHGLIPIVDDWHRILFTALGSILEMEGSVILTAAIVLFYSCRDSKKRLAIGYSAYCAAYFLLYVPEPFIRLFDRLRASSLPAAVTDILALPFEVLGLRTHSMDAAGSFTDSLLRVNYQWMMVFALPLMLLYNGKRGRGSKRFFYVYYPAHLFLLYMISAL